MSRTPVHTSFFRSAMVLTAGATLLIVGAAGCTRGNNSGGDTHEEPAAERPAPTPRRTAYPRINVPEASYFAIDSLPLVLEANVAANAEISKRTNENVWLDVTYPDLNAVIYITVSDAATPGQMAEIIANRSERIALNLSGNPTESCEFTTDDGSEAQLIIDRHGSSTPVHFLAAFPANNEEYDTGMRKNNTKPHHGVVLSGTAFVESNATAASDSIAPVIDLLVRDISHMLSTAKASKSF